MSILNMNAESYRTYTQAEKPVLVEFSAPWCVYCRRLAPALEAVAEEYRDTLVFGAVNIDDEPELARSEEIEVVPTLLLYQNGQVVGSVVAPESKAQLVSFIEETLRRRQQEGGAERHVYDMIVVGGGPGGYTAALYAARAGLDTVVLEKLSAGGQMALTEQIDNYPGFEDGIDGFSLGEKMKRGTERFGVETKLTEVLSLDLSGAVKKAETSEGTLYARTIVVATGAGPRELGVADERELIGKGVNYCSACDGMFYKNKTVVIAGGRKHRGGGCPDPLPHLQEGDSGPPQRHLEGDKNLPCPILLLMYLHSDCVTVSENFGDYHSEVLWGRRLRERTGIAGRAGPLLPRPHAPTRR